MLSWLTARLVLHGNAGRISSVVVTVYRVVLITVRAKVGIRAGGNTTGWQAQGVGPILEDPHPKMVLLCYTDLS